MSRMLPQPDRVASTATYAAATYAGARSRGLLDVYSADCSGDHELLDLGGALEDVVDLRVAVPALDGILARVAVAAEDLDRALGHPHRDLARLELAHRSLGVLKAHTRAAHPRGAPDEQTRRVDLHLHPCERERDGLVLDDLAPELLTLLGIRQRILIGSTRDPERLRTNGGTRGLKRLHRRLRLAPAALAHPRQTLVKLLLATKDIRARNPAVIQEHIGRMRSTQPML